MNKTYPILYSRTSTGAVQTWQIFVKDSSFSVESGQLEGKKVISEPNYCEGKNIGKTNETSPNEQALLEAQSKFDKKKKSKGYFESIEDIDEETFINPMLAKKYQDYEDKIKEEVIIQPKQNGSRCIATKNGLFTRTGERFFTCPHIIESLQGIFKKCPEAVIDGELLCTDYRNRLNETMKLIRRDVHIEPHHLEESRKLVKYIVYDCFNIEFITSDDGYERRKVAFEAVLKGNKYCIPIESIYCKNKEEVYKQHGKYVENAEEGSIIRLLNEPYVFKRSSALLKLKNTDDSEGEILDILTGSGNWGDCGKVITLKWKGKVFNATFKGTQEDSREFLNNKEKYIGRIVTFTYNGLTGKEFVPNYAQVDFANAFKK